MIVESKNKNKEGFYKELNAEVILKDFLNHYYKNVIYNEHINIEEINDSEENYSEGNEENIYDTKIDIKNKHICYYIKTIKKVQNEQNKDIDSIINVLMEYIKYDKQLKIVDKDTLEKKFEKSKNQGDLEKQHYLIETLNNSNKALLVWEKILGAITIGQIEIQMKNDFKKWIEVNYKDEEEKKKYLLGYTIKIYSIPSKNLIEELLKLDKISILKATVKKEKLTLDEDIIFSEENISREDVELIYKPKKGLSFSSIKVKKYIESFKKGGDIKKIVINGSKDGSLITLNTELMKMSEYVDVKEGIDGLINSEDLFDKYKNLISNKEEYLNEIFVDVDIDQEE